jgi:ankyrin repeat protein
LSAWRTICDACTSCRLAEGFCGGVTRQGCGFCRTLGTFLEGTNGIRPNAFEQIGTFAVAERMPGRSLRQAASGADVEGSISEIRTPLLSAVKRDMPELVEVLLQYRANPNARDPSGRSALTYAVAMPDTRLASELIRAGADVNRPDALLDLPLNRACRSLPANTKMIRLLIGSGAYINAADTSRMTPLSVACWQGNLGLVRYLVSLGASLDPIDTYGNTPLMLSKTPTTQYLLRCGATVNHWNQDGYSPLMYAICRGDTPAVKSLIAAGATLESRDEKASVERLASESGVAAIRSIIISASTRR